MVPGLALLGLDRVTIIVSFTSSKASSTMPAIVIVVDVAPAAMVAVPLARVKSVPEPVAVPVTA